MGNFINLNILTVRPVQLPRYNNSVKRLNYRRDSDIGGIDVIGLRGSNSKHELN